MREKALERLLKYVSIETTSDPNSQSCPSTKVQWDLAKHLVEELKAIGLDASVDDNCYVMAKLNANIDGVDPIGFIAHMDTAPDMSGKNIKPRIVKNYDGSDIVLNKELNIVTKVNEYPELKELIGEDVIVTDGTTLLGADDKAGVAEIVTGIEYLVNHPEIKHGDIMIGFTPDEEIGRGADLFDVEKFGAKYAYTLDGGAVGELEYENFNAASAVVKVQGRNVHPGSAKNKLINANILAVNVINAFPESERPETTEGYEGFYHLNDMAGNVEEIVMNYIIRDHDDKKFEQRKQFFASQIENLSEKYDGRITVEIKDQYYNMKKKIEPVSFMVDIAVDAMKEIDVEPLVIPIRGGTDGAQLSFKGLPCPNLFTGGLNFHGRNECIPVSALEKGAKLVVKIAQKYAQR